jgi:hypothetical protein
VYSLALLPAWISMPRRTPTIRADYDGHDFTIVDVLILLTCCYGQDPADIVKS